MSGNPNPSKAEAKYSSWFEDSETRLLEDFTREYLVPMYGLGAVPLAKDWDAHDQRAWDKWVDKAWADEGDSGQDEDEGRDR